LEFFMQFSSLADCVRVQFTQASILNRSRASIQTALQIAVRLPDGVCNPVRHPTPSETYAAGD